jgi:predicted nucleic acid-binding protein
LNETSNVWFKKCGWNGAKIKQHLDNIEAVCDEVAAIQRHTIDKALTLKDIYGYSYYDCLIIASALENDCEVLFSEDMTNEQIVENRLKIINPFRTLPQ